MRLLVAAVALCVVTGCNQPFPTAEQAKSAELAVAADSSPRIVPQALTGTWKSKDGSSLDFGLGGRFKYRVDGLGEGQGLYRLERYRLISMEVGRERPIGWINLTTRNELVLTESREVSRRFVLES